MRDELLSAIKANKDDDIEKALRALSESNPTRAPAKSDKLFGKWKLLWASPNSEVAKATRRNPLPSYSEQLIGMRCLPIPTQLTGNCLHWGVCGQIQLACFSINIIVEVTYAAPTPACVITMLQNHDEEHMSWVIVFTEHMLAP